MAHSIHHGLWHFLCFWLFHLGNFCYVRQRMAPPIARGIFARSHCIYPTAVSIHYTSAKTNWFQLNLKALDTLSIYYPKLIVSNKIYLVTSNGELYIKLENHCKNDSLWSSVVFEKEVLISHSNIKILQPWGLLLCIWKHTNLCNKGDFSVIIISQLRWLIG